MSKRIDLDILQDIGLTPAESKVYVALLKLGSSKASNIVRDTRLQNSSVHLTLGRLIERGFVTFVKRGQVRYFRATHPEVFSRLIENKRERLNKLIPQLLSMYTPFENQDAEVFEGVNGFQSMLYQLIDDGERGDEFLFFAFYHQSPEVQDEIYPIYTKYEQERLSRGLKLKGIVPEEVKAHFIKRKQKHLVYTKFPILTNINIFRNKVSLTPWGDRKVSFLLTSTELATHFRAHFYAIWNLAKVKNKNL